MKWMNLKEIQYQGATLEYTYLVLDPSSSALYDEMEKVQTRVAKFLTGSFSYETRTCILEQVNVRRS